MQDPAHPNSIARTIRNIMVGQRQPLPEGVSPPCRELITCLLQTDPSQRASLEVGWGAPGIGRQVGRGQEREWQPRSHMLGPLLLLARQRLDNGVRVQGGPGGHERGFDVSHWLMCQYGWHG